MGAVRGEIPDVAVVAIDRGGLWVDVGAEGIDHAEELPSGATFIEDAAAGVAGGDLGFVGGAGGACLGEIEGKDFQSAVAEVGLGFDGGLDFIGAEAFGAGV